MGKNIFAFNVLDSVECAVTYAYGNATMLGQGLLAGASLCSGICSLSDTFTCLSMPAKCCYAASSVCSFASFGCYGGAAISQLIAPPISPVLLGCGFGIGRAGKYIRNTGSLMNPLPALSDVA